MNRIRSKRSWYFAFGISLTFHLCLILALELAVRAGLLESDELSAPKDRAETVAMVFQLEPELQPTEFVDADPAQATEEAPEETPYYARIDAVASDDSPEDSQDRPRLDGEQEKVLKTADTPLPVPPVEPVTETIPEPEEAILEPEVSASEPERELSRIETPENLPEPEGQGWSATVTEPAPPEERQTEPNLDPNPNPNPNPEPAPVEERKRPRKLAEVLPDQSALVGRKFKQDGGVSRYRVQATFDLLKTPFGDYDSMVIRTIQQRWFDILADNPAVRHARGKVVLKFQMNSDGSIQDLRVVEDTVGIIQALVCQQAVSEPAPFRPWPAAMLNLIGHRREVQFGFFFN